MDAILHFTVANQQIERADDFTVVEGSENYLQAQFDFTTPDWDGLIKTGVFIDEDGSVHPSLCDGDICDVPSEWLVEQKGAVGVIGSDGTVKITTAAVRVRIKPKGYTGEDVEEEAGAYFDQIMAAFAETLAAVNKSAAEAKAAETSAQAWAHGHEAYPERGEDNAAYYAGQARSAAANTAADLTEVGRIAGTVALSEGRVLASEEAVTGLSAQAQAAANNALLSEQAAKASEESAAQSAASAEAASGQTAQDALETASARAAAEAAKSIVLAASQQVTEDRAAVEGLAASFELAHQQAVADVNNAGQAQVERVEEAGDSAVDDVAAAKSQAATEITNAGAAQIQAIGTAGTEQAAAVAAEGTTQVAAVQEAAAEIISDRKQIGQNQRDILSTSIIRQASGTDIMVADSAEMPLQGLVEYGHTVQGSTTGAQLFDKSTIIDHAFIDDFSGQIRIVTDTGSVNYLRNASDFIDVSGIENIYIGTGNDTGNWGAFYDGDKNFVAGISGYGRPCAVPETAHYARFTVNDAILDTFMLNPGSTALPYEPYTGGQPSPNPDYPQEIVSAGDKGSIEVEVTGKNLFDAQRTLETGETSPFVEVDGEYIATSQTTNIQVPVSEFVQRHIGKIVTVSFDIRADVKLNISVYAYQYAGITIIPGTDATNVFGYTVFSIGSQWKHCSYVGIVADKEKMGSNYGRIIFYNADLSNNNLQVKNLQIELGNKASAYEPYKSQTLTIQTPNGLPGIPVTSGGNYTDESGQQWIADEIDFGRGVYVQRVAKKVLDGSENVSGYMALTDGNGYAGWIATTDRDAKTREVLCTHLKFDSRTQGPTMKYGTITGAINNAPVWMTFSAELETATDAKNYLKDCYDAGMPIIVYYILATPTEIPLSAEELAAYRALHTNYPTTVITNDAECHMEAEYVADSENYITQNYVPKSSYDALEGRVAALEQNTLNNV